MGRPKALLPAAHDGASTTLELLLRAYGARSTVVVVTNAKIESDVRRIMHAAGPDGPRSSGCSAAHPQPGPKPGAGLSVQSRIAVNPRPEDGMFSSIRLGLALVPQDAAGVFVTPVDCVPTADPAPVLDAMLHAMRTAPNPAGAFVPVFAGKRGHPVLLVGHAPMRRSCKGGSQREGDPGGPAGSAAAPRVHRKQSGSRCPASALAAMPPGTVFCDALERVGVIEVPVAAEWILLNINTPADYIRVLERLSRRSQ